MKFIIDANLSPRWVARLREAGIDASHWSELGPADAPDIEIIAFARKSRSIILTRDLDFGAHMALSKAEKPSIVQLRAKVVSPEDIGDRVTRKLCAIADDLEQGAVVTIDLTRTRVTLLPFPPTSQN